MKLDQFATMRGMQLAHTATNQVLLDHLLNDAENGSKIRQDVLIKRIQFDTTQALFAKLENVCALLECSKREFLEMAVYEAIQRAEIVFGTAYEEAAGRPFGETEE